MDLLRRSPANLSPSSTRGYSLFVPSGPSISTYIFFFFNDTATTEIYTLSLHDALPISHFMISNFIPLNPQQLDAAIVDLDGTMVNTLGDFAEALNRMLADLQLPAIAPQAIETMVGKGSEHLIRSVLAHVGAADVDAIYGQAWQRYEHHYLQLNGQFAEVYPGVLEGLQALRARGLRLACLTNKPLSFAQPLLAQKGLAPLFE